MPCRASSFHLAWFSTVLLFLLQLERVCGTGQPALNIAPLKKTPSYFFPSDRTTTTLDPADSKLEVHGEFDIHGEEDGGGGTRQEEEQLRQPIRYYCDCTSNSRESASEFITESDLTLAWSRREETHVSHFNASWQYEQYSIFRNMVLAHGCAPHAKNVHAYNIPDQPNKANIVAIVQGDGQFCGCMRRSYSVPGNFKPEVLEKLALGVPNAACNYRPWSCGHYMDCVQGVCIGLGGVCTLLGTYAICSLDSHCASGRCDEGRCTMSPSERLDPSLDAEMDNYTGPPGDFDPIVSPPDPNSRGRSRNSDPSSPGFTHIINNPYVPIRPYLHVEVRDHTAPLAGHYDFTYPTQAEIVTPRKESDAIPFSPVQPSDAANVFDDASPSSSLVLLSEKNSSLLGGGSIELPESLYDDDFVLNDHGSSTQVVSFPENLEDTSQNSFGRRVMENTKRVSLLSSKMRNHAVPSVHDKVSPPPKSMLRADAPPFHFQSKSSLPAPKHVALRSDDQKDEGVEPIPYTSIEPIHIVPVYFAPVMAVSHPFSPSGAKPVVVVVSQPPPPPTPPAALPPKAPKKSASTFDSAFVSPTFLPSVKLYPTQVSISPTASSTTRPHGSRKASHAPLFMMDITSLPRATPLTLPSAVSMNRRLVGSRSSSDRGRTSVMNPPQPRRLKDGEQDKAVMRSTKKQSPSAFGKHSSP